MHTCLHSLLAFVLRLMPRPPRRTLFPYTTLFRSASPCAPTPPSSRSTNTSRPREPSRAPSMYSLNDLKRSEEHTSELQSRENLVCRLLLEKKKMYARRCRHSLTSP